MKHSESGLIRGNHPLDDHLQINNWLNQLFLIHSDYSGGTYYVYINYSAIIGSGYLNRTIVSPTFYNYNDAATYQYHLINTIGNDLQGFIQRLISQNPSQYL